MDPCLLRKRCGRHAGSKACHSRRGWARVHLLLFRSLATLSPALSGVPATVDIIPVLAVTSRTVSPNSSLMYKVAYRIERKPSPGGECVPPLPALRRLKEIAGPIGSGCPAYTVTFEEASIFEHRSRLPVDTYRLPAGPRRLQAGQSARKAPFEAFGTAPSRQLFRSNRRSQGLRLQSPGARRWLPDERPCERSPVATTISTLAGRGWQAKATP